MKTILCSFLLLSSLLLVGCGGNRYEMIVPTNSDYAYVIDKKTGHVWRKVEDDGTTWSSWGCPPKDAK